jgi:hypothetical protein
MKLAPVSLALLAHAIICAAQSVNNPCKLPPDLFERRAVLEKQLEAPVLEHLGRPQSLGFDQWGGIGQFPI